MYAQNAIFNKSKADSLGADEYGMKMYSLVILKTGHEVIIDEKVKDSLFKGHMDNINRMATEGKLIIAGPFGKNDKNYRGIFILNATSSSEAETLIKTDPAIAAGMFDVEIFGWYGPAALPEYLKVQSTIEKMKH